MKTRKTVLLSSCAVLLCVCIIQWILAAHNPVKTLMLNDSPDFMEITTPSAKVELYLDGSTWYVGHDNFQAENISVENMIKAIKEIKVLDTVAKISSDDFNERYELNEGKACTVTAKKGDKIIRTLNIGKSSSTGSQTYITVGSSKNINLVSGNLQAVFNKTEDSLKSKTVYNIAAKDITSVTVTAGKNTFGVEKDSTVQPAEWKFTPASGDKAEADGDKIDAWLNNISTCSTTAWVQDSKILPSKKISAVEIDSASEKITVDIYQEGSGADTKYICTSNRTPHRFELTENSASKYKKTLDELKK